MKRPTGFTSSKRQRRTACAVLLAFALIASVVGVRTSNRSLLDRSSPIATVLNKPFIWWQTPNEFLRYDPETQSFHSHNMQAGTTFEETYLSQAFKKTGGMPKQTFLSPDGTQLVWLGWVPNSDVAYNYVSAIGGEHYTKYPNTISCLRGWAAGGGSWFECFQRDPSLPEKLILHPLAIDGVEKQYTLRNSSPWPFMEREVFFDEKKQSLLYVAYNTRNSQSCVVRQGQILGETVQIKDFAHVHFPIPANVWDIKISPRGDKIAWLLYWEYRNPVVKTLSRYVRGMDVPMHPVIDIWVSNIRGERFTKLGSLMAPAGTFKNAAQRLQQPEPDRAEVPESITWLPDNASLSYLYKNVLYTIKSPSISSTGL